MIEHIEHNGMLFSISEDRKEATVCLTLNYELETVFVPHLL